ncbi:response regulator [Roseicyclus mahoneyensis]|uniref:Response regulator receiver domain-containing protein n=1 Tax=Roseicyclus mahoneyensis TaxID=164332 RepID=A0A316GL16_9RHOB|nr:response regulator [Roseicyclus mahoneyensis]PWK60708.1 response regulator receiver domain-containing protein [Roseicyclus mahoneyensis]
MDDDLTHMDFRPRPTPERPLLGLTILVVEDSRFASEAMRLLCLRSGARIRRADCIASAERHLNVYRPSVAIVDLGLPDGSGHDLIARIHAMRPRVPILLGTSGADRDTAEAEARAAGADGFLPKPVEALALFQAAILEHMPEAMRPRLPRLVEPGAVTPDLIAYREDLTHAMELLALDDPPVGYLRRFLLGVARTARDDGLEDCANGMTPALDQDGRSTLRHALSSRIQGLPMAM